MAKNRRGKGAAGSALRRQWLELKFLAEARFAKSVVEVLAYVREEGHFPSRRTVERDLLSLQPIFHLVADGNTPQGWRFDRNAPRTLLPGLSAHEALTFLLVEQQLVSLLPNTVRAHLKGHFEAARTVLGAEEGRQAAAWSKRVCAVSRAQPMLPAKVAPEVADAVYDAVLRGRQLEVRYRNRSGETKAYALHPQGLAVRDTATYLVALVGDFDDPVLFLLHRMRTAKVLELPARTAKGFDVRGYIDREVPFPLAEGPIRLVLRVAEAVLPSFEETPLSNDQAIEEAGDRYLVRATVRDTRTLRSFILGYGPTVEVLEPRELRSALREDAIAMERAYRCQPAASARRRKA